MKRYYVPFNFNDFNFKMDGGVGPPSPLWNHGWAPNHDQRVGAFPRVVGDFFL